MMRYNNIINGLLAIASILAFTACTEDTYDNSAAEEWCFSIFRAFQAYIQERTHPPTTIKKAFEAGTKYQLFAVENDKLECLIIYRKPQARTQIEGTEAADHTISFDGNNKFNNHSLNFLCSNSLSDKRVCTGNKNIMLTTVSHLLCLL